MDEVRVETWNDLQDQLFEGAWQPDLRRFRSPYAFRGVPSAKDNLQTSLMSLGGDFAAMEKHLLRNFRKYASRSNVEKDSTWNWLSLAKHHGLPNRLLDWSFSPLVALHFATDNLEKFDQDSTVWMVDYRQVHSFLPEPLKAELALEGSDILTVDMLAAAAGTLEDFDRLAPDLFAAFFEPPSLDERIVNQFAMFSILSSPAASFDEWLDGRPELYRKLVIPAGLKWEVRDKLDQANITERVLFPGLDGLSRWLARQYTQRM